MMLSQGNNVNPIVHKVQKKLRLEITRRFVTGEREGHMEDLLIATFLDPRFKHFVFQGATQKMRREAVKFARASYDADWSPDALARAEAVQQKKVRAEMKKAQKADSFDEDEDEDDGVQVVVEARC